MTFPACVKLYFPFKLHKRDSRGHRQAIHLALLSSSKEKHQTTLRMSNATAALYSSTSPLRRQLEPAQTPCWLKCSERRAGNSQEFPCRDMAAQDGKVTFEAKQHFGMRQSHRFFSSCYITMFWDVIEESCSSNNNKAAINQWDKSILTHKWMKHKYGE